MSSKTDFSEHIMSVSLLHQPYYFVAHCSFGYNMYLERHCISNLKLDKCNRVWRQRTICDLFISQEKSVLCVTMVHVQLLLD